jgi:hypothetical protein
LYTIPTLAKQSPHYITPKARVYLWNAKERIRKGCPPYETDWHLIYLQISRFIDMMSETDKLRGENDH